MFLLRTEIRIGVIKRYLQRARDGMSSLEAARKKLNENAGIVI